MEKCVYYMERPNVHIDGFILIDNRFNGTHRIYFVKLIRNYIEFCNIIETKEIMLPEICDRKELFCIIETHIYDGELIYKYGAFTVREKQIDYKNVFTQLLDYSHNREFPYMNEMSDKSCDFFIKYYRDIPHSDNFEEYFRSL